MLANMFACVALIQLVIIQAALGQTNSAKAKINAFNLINQYRGRHGVPAMILKPAANDSAQNWADYLINKAKIEFSVGFYGESIFKSASVTSSQSMANRAINSWYNQITSYRYNNPVYSKATGDFTQLVWRTSKAVDIGVAHRGFTVIVVARYFPPGNNDGEFTLNVLPRIPSS